MSVLSQVTPFNVVFGLSLLDSAQCSNQLFPDELCVGWGDGLGEFSPVHPVDTHAALPVRQRVSPVYVPAAARLVRVTFRMIPIDSHWPRLVECPTVGLIHPERALEEAVPAYFQPEKLAAQNDRTLKRRTHDILDHEGPPGRAQCVSHRSYQPDLRTV
jgi:hypothetical protein